VYVYPPAAPMPNFPGLALEHLPELEALPGLEDLPPPPLHIMPNTRGHNSQVNHDFSHFCEHFAGILGVLV
jgi:hypothetical protein